MIVILMVTSDFDSEADGESFSPLFTYLLLYSSPWKGLQGEVVDERHPFLSILSCGFSQHLKTAFFPRLLNERMENLKQARYP